MTKVCTRYSESSEEGYLTQPGWGDGKWWEMAGRIKDYSKNAMIAGPGLGKLAHIWFLMFVILSVTMFQTFTEIDWKKYMIHVFIYVPFKYTQKRLINILLA